MTTHLGAYGAKKQVCDTYRKMFNKGVPFDENIAAEVAGALLEMYRDLCSQALANDELERFSAVEMPAYRMLQLLMSAGIAINAEDLSEKRALAEHEYFSCLKAYSDKQDMPLETPSRRAIASKLHLQGFELDEVSLEYLLEFVPHERDFGGDTMALLALDTARRVLSSLTLNSDIIRPVVDVFGSRTSRIQLRSPSLQNIPKQYRTIIAAHDGGQLSYVDFDQFEVGIMAALSGDEELKRLYAAGDMYELLPGRRRSATSPNVNKPSYLRETAPPEERATRLLHQTGGPLASLDCGLFERQDASVPAPAEKQTFPRSAKSHLQTNPSDPARLPRPAPTPNAPVDRPPANPSSIPPCWA